MKLAKIEEKLFTQCNNNAKYQHRAKKSHSALKSKAQQTNIRLQLIKLMVSFLPHNYIKFQDVVASVRIGLLLFFLFIKRTGEKEGREIDDKYGYIDEIKRQTNQTIIAMCG